MRLNGGYADEAAGFIDCRMSAPDPLQTHCCDSAKFSRKPISDGQHFYQICSIEAYVRKKVALTEVVD